MIKIITTKRLIIRPLLLSDAKFILKLVNTEDFIKYIGDKEIRSIEEAENYLISGPLKMYKEYGIGLCLLETKEQGTPVGINGLIKRESLDDIDIGYGLLPEYYRKGYAYESSIALVEFAKEKYQRLIAITNSNNKSSIKLLEKLGMKFEKNLKKLTNSVNLRLYGINFNDN